MDFNARVRKLLGVERQKTTEERIFERLEEAKWLNTKRKLDAICESDDVDFEVTCMFIGYCDEDESYCNVSYNILPVYKHEEKISKYEEILNRLGLKNSRQNIQNGISVGSNKTELDMLDQITKGKDIEFHPTAYYRFIDDKLQLDIGYKAVIIDKEEDIDDIFITLNIDSQRFKSKPDKRETAAIQKRMSSNKKQVTIPEFISAIEEGRSFKAAALNGNKNIDWESQQVFALDIDNDEKSISKYGLLTPEKAVKRFEDLRVPPAFYYESFSSTEDKPKFRLIFIVKNPVTDIRIRNAIQIALMAIMPESDKACKDLSRLFYGTNKECKLINNSDCFLDVYAVIQSMLVYTKESNSKSSACKKIQKYCREVSLNMINGYPDVMLLDICGERKKTPNSIIYTIEQGTKFPYKIVFHFTDYIDNKKYTNIKNECSYNLKDNNIERTEIKNFRFDELQIKCKLWKDFITGDRWCYHNEVFGIASNMWNIRGAQKRMIDTINNNNFYCDKQNKINAVKSCSAYGYMPTRCENFCPYYKSCSNTGLNMLHVVDNTRGSIRMIKETKTVKLSEAEEMLKQVFLQAYSEEGKTITIIKGGTGIGKTTLLNSILDFNGLSISYPNHRLGEDIVSRVKVDNALHLKELSLNDKSVLNEFRRLQSIGAYKSARLYLEQYKKSIIEKCESGEIGQSDADKIVMSITNYFEDINKASSTKGTIFSTHKKMLELSNENIKTYIIDEDILMSSIILTESLKLSQLDYYIKLSKRHKAITVTNYLNNLRAQVLKAIKNTNETFKVEKIDVDIKEINRLIQCECNNLKSNLRDILNISAVVADENGEVLGMAIGKLPDKKCIILSATANEKIYRLLFPERDIKFVDIGNIETEGELIFHYDGFSRNKLSKDFDKCIEKIKQETKGINNVITFAKFENNFRKAGFNSIAHFGACSGLDAYKGQDLIVAGTPHIDSRVYNLLASIIDEDFESNHPMEYSNVIRNGYEFYFNTFKSSKLLQEIQFYFIESELVQAVGRARILRTDANVHLFSNYPIAGSKLYKKIA